MKKLALKLDSLAVETFDPAPVQGGRGTVVGEQATFASCVGPTCDGTCLDPTCQADCPSQVGQTCADSCWGTCYNTCGTCARTCYYTCNQATCYTCGRC